MNTTNPTPMKGTSMKTRQGTMVAVALAICALLFPAGDAKAQDAAAWTAMFEDLHSRHFDPINNLAYLVEVFEHAMGENFHAPPGATVDLSPSWMAIELYWVLTLDETSTGSPTRPLVWPEGIMDGRPAMTYWDSTGGRYIFWNPDYYYPAYSESVGAYYLEQVGHYLNTARCEIAGAPMGQSGRSCPTDHGGSPGARFRDIWLALGPTSSAEAAGEYRSFAHPRAQLVTETYGSGFVESDGQSSVMPIDIIRDAGHDRYTRRAVLNLLGSEGEATGFFRYLEQEHGLQVPQFVYKGSYAVVSIHFVVESGRLVRVEYRLPENTSSWSLEADQLWYTVAQALVDTIHGPLTGTDRCLRRIFGNPIYTDHLWLSGTSDFDPAEQSEECLHRDTLAHALVGALVHQHEFDHLDDGLMDHLYDQVYTREHPEIRERVRHLGTEQKSCLAMWEANGIDFCNSPTTQVHTAHNISGTSGSVVVSSVSHEDSCEPETLDDYEDTQCLAVPEDDFCVAYEWDWIDNRWATVAEHCSRNLPILCQKATDMGSSQNGDPKLAMASTDLRATRNSYRLDFADEACAIEFPRGQDASGRKFVWTAVWRPAMPTVGDHVTLPNTVGTGGVSCASGTKRACEGSASEVVQLSGNRTAGRKRLRKGIQNAIRYGLPPAITKTSAPKHDVLRIHAINVGNGSCNLLQCMRFEGTSNTPTKVENALIDCGSSHSNPDFGGLETAGVVSYLSGAHFYSTAADPPLFVSSHPDRDHFSHMPGIVNQPANGAENFVPWWDEDLSFILGGWPEEFVGSYGNRSRATQDATALTQNNRDRDRSRMRALLGDDEGGSRIVNGDEILPGFDLAGTLADAVRINPAVAETLAGFTNCQTSTLELVEVNTPAGGSNLSNRQAVRRNRSSAVLQATFQPSQGSTLLTVLPGDALSYTENQALAKMAVYPASQWTNRILMASHHGASTGGSNSATWANQISPTRVFYSSGTGHYLHPDATVVEYTYDPILRSSDQHNIIVGDPDPDWYTHRPFSTSKKHHGTIDHGTLVFEAVMPIDASGSAQSPTYRFLTVGPIQ